MNPQSSPIRPPFNDVLYQALSPLKERMETDRKIQQVKMRYDAAPKKMPTRNNAANGPLGEVYQ